MKGGLPSKRGYSYQDYVGVSRVLEFAYNTDLKWIEFESEDNLLEDITRGYLTKVVFEQVKYKANSDWTPSDMKPVMTGFVKRFQEYENDLPLHFELTTNTKPNPDVSLFQTSITNAKSINQFIESIKKKGKTIKDFFDVRIDEKVAFEISKSLTFNWLTGVTLPEEPLKKIKQDCVDLLKAKCEYNLEEGEVIVGLLLENVVQKSVELGLYRRYTVKDFRRYIPNCGRIDSEYIKSLLPNDVIDILLQNNPSRLYGPVDMKFGDNHSEVSIVYDIGGAEILLWVINETSLNQKIASVNRIVSKGWGYSHIILILNDQISNTRFDDHIRHFVIRQNEYSRLSDLLEEFSSGTR